MEIDLKARLMGETLILNTLLDRLYRDYIKLNDLNEPLELRRNQVNDLEPTIEEGEFIDEPMMDILKTRNDDEIIEGLDEYSCYCDFDRKIHIDCAFNQQFSCMIDNVEYKGKNIVGAFMNVTIFVGNFSVVTDFAVADDMDSYFLDKVDDMDSYRDERMSDIIVGRPFCKACVKASRFDGMIIICKGNDSVTYQMAQPHLTFKHLTNSQCYKIRPLLKNDGIQNQIGNGNLVAVRAEGNAARPRRRDAAYLQTQLLIAQKEETRIQLQAEEYDLMAAADLDEIEEVNANCILMANLQQALSSGTQTDSAPVYDSDGSAE
nr:hypothetical protein [Tanacetum cinerariifolium]